MAITLSPKQQVYVEDLMRGGSFESEEIAIDEALLHMLEQRRRERQIGELVAEGRRRLKAEGPRSGGEELRKRLDAVIRKNIAEGRKPSDHIVHGI